jgi:hypothetical protein
MKKSILGLALMIPTLLTCLRAEPARPDRVQLAAIVSWISGDNDTYGKFSNIGPGVRVDFNLASWFMISPEISYLAGEDGGLSLGGTVNGKFGPAYAGIGAIALNKTSLIYFKDPGVVTNAFWKLQAGFKSRHWLLSVSYVTDSFRDPWLRAFGLSAGYVF